MLVRLSLVVAALLLASCVDSEDPGISDPATFEVAEHVSRWLDPDVKLNNKVSFATLNGRDIRQAAYYMPEDGPRQLAVTIRDYSSRRTGIPDEQFVLQIDPVAGRGELVKLPESVVPLAMSFAMDQSWGVIGLLGKHPSKGATGWQSSFLRIPPREQQPFSEFDSALIPTQLKGDGTVVCRQLSSVQLDGGILAPSTDWTAPLIEITPDGTVLEYTGVDWRFNPAGGWYSGYTVEHSPTSPGDSSVTLAVMGSASSSGQSHYKLPYHLTYTAFEWLPVVMPVDAHHLAMIRFLPETTDSASRPGYAGIFRISVLDTTRGSWNVVEDHVERDLGLVVVDGVLFYSLREPGGANRWSIWASDCAGLRKRRLWTVDDSIFVAVADVSDTGQLLVERQYFDEALGMPQLHSELREISLKPLEYSTAVDRNSIVRNIIDGTQVKQVPRDSTRPPAITGPAGSLTQSGNQSTEGR